MKRLLLSLAGGFLVPFTWLVVAGPLSASAQSPTLRFLLDLPYGWPRVLYYRFCLPRCSLLDNEAAFVLYLVASNVILYALLTYAVLWLRSGLKRPKHDFAPPPPGAGRVAG